MRRPKVTRESSLSSLPAGRFVVTKFSQSGVGRRNRSRIWFSPVGSSFEHFRNCKIPGGFLCCGMKSISGGVAVEHPKIRGKTRVNWSGVSVAAEVNKFATGFFEGKARSKKLTNQSSMKGRDTRQAQ
jgi:hypothetical protein